MFKNLKVGVRLALGFGIMVIFMVVLAGVSLKSLSNIQGNLNRIVTVNNKRAIHANDIASMVREVSVSLRNMLLEKSLEKRLEQKQRIEEYRAIYLEAFKKLEELTPKDDAKAQELLANFRSALDAARSSNTKMMELALSGTRDAQAIEVMNIETRPLIRKLITETEALVKFQEERSQFRYDEGVAEYRRVRWIVYGVGVLAVLMALGIAFHLTRQITVPLKHAVEVNDKLALGDTTVAIRIDSQDRSVRC